MEPGENFQASSLNIIMKKTYLVSSLFIIPMLIFSQNTFHKLITLDFPVSRFMSVLATDSCYYVIGTVTDSFFRAGAMWGKIDLKGDLLALKTFRHPQKDYFNDYGDIQSTSEGFLFNIGSYNDSEPSTQAIFYLYNQQGDTLLTRKYKSVLYPASNFVVPTNVIQKSDGGFAILAAHHKDDDSKNTEISLLLTDSLLQVQAYHQYGGTPLNETPSSLIFDNDGGFIIGAERSNDGQVFKGFYNLTLIIKTDSMGKEIWRWLSPGKLEDEAKAIIQTTDGGLVVASGYGMESSNNPHYHSLFWDSMIYKLDSNRNMVWKTLFRGFHPSTQTEIAEMVAAGDENGFVAACIIAEKEGNDPAYHTSWLIKVSLQGDSLWAIPYTYFDGEFVAPEVYDMKATPDGGYVLVGFSRYVGLPVPGWIMKVDSFGCLIPGCNPTNAVVEPGQINPSLVVYPNPVSDLLNFHLRGTPRTYNAAFRILNQEGKLMAETGLVNVQATFTIPVAGWQPGVYWLEGLTNGVKICSTKFVKL